MDPSDLDRDPSDLALPWDQKDGAHALRRLARLFGSILVSPLLPDGIVLQDSLSSLLKAVAASEMTDLDLDPTDPVGAAAGGGSDPLCPSDWDRRSATAFACWALDASPQLLRGLGKGLADLMADLPAVERYSPDLVSELRVLRSPEGAGGAVGRGAERRFDLSGKSAFRS